MKNFAATEFLHFIDAPTFLACYVYITTTITMYKLCFSGTLAFFSLPAAGLFSCSRLRGTQGARPDPIRKFGPRPRAVAHALGVESGTSARGGIPST